MLISSLGMITMNAAAKAAIFLVAYTLIRLGYFLGLKKSILTPQKSVPYIGFQADSAAYNPGGLSCLQSYATKAFVLAYRGDHCALLIPTRSGWTPMRDLPVDLWVFTIEFL